LEATLSEAELTAYLTFVLRESGWTMRSLQVRLLAGNRFEASGQAVSGAREYPVYLRGTAELQGEGIAASLDKARLAGLPLPSGQRREIEEGIEEELIAEFGNGGRTRLSAFETAEGSIHVSGEPR
jgi:hypothetical protein